LVISKKSSTFVADFKNKQETKVFDGYSETFNTYDECVKRKKELEKISNKQYINFEIVELKN
jgi:hypothetical protein